MIASNENHHREEAERIGIEAAEASASEWSHIEDNPHEERRTM
jgi:hypothetical protein